MSETSGGPKIRFDVMPPEETELWLPIFSPKPGCMINGEVISEHLIGVWTHYVGRRTVPHIEDRSLCEGCIAKRGKRWKGYLAILYTSIGRMGLAELTPWALNNCQELRQQPYRTVRGWLIGLSRPNGPENGRVTLTMQPPPIRRAGLHLPEPPDVPAALMRIWTGRRDGPTGVLSCGDWLEEPPF